MKHTPKEARQLWIDALRSGDYEQTRETLCEDGRYCCLGVACEVAIQNEPELQIYKIEKGYAYDGIDAVKNSLLEGLKCSSEDVPIKVCYG